MPDPRLVPPTDRPFMPSTEAPVTHITHVEDRALPGPVLLRQLMATPGMVLVETTFQPGGGSSPHRHLDHDSIVYVVRGRMRVTIDGRVFEAGPGDAWYNAPGVEHHLEALEETVSVEIKSPPVRTW